MSTNGDNNRNFKKGISQSYNIGAKLSQTDSIRMEN